MSLLKKIFVLSTGLALASCGPSTPEPVATPSLDKIPNVQFDAYTRSAQTRSVVVRNTGNASLNYTITLNNTPWLTIASGSAGQVPAGGEATVQLVAACGAEAGTFQGTATASSSGLNPVTFQTSLNCTEAPDTTPDPFSFQSVTDVQPGTVITSNTVTISGLNSEAPITLTGGGSLIVNGQPYAGTTVKNGDRIAVRSTASSAFETASSVRVTIGGVHSDFTVTTGAADTTPDPFTFETIKDAAPGSIVTSNTITVSGLNAPAKLSISGGATTAGTVLVNGEPYTGTAVKNGDNIAIRLQVGGPGSTYINIITLGTFSTAFTVSTVQTDTTPDPFSFQGVSDVQPGTVVTSNTVTISGLNTEANIEFYGAAIYGASLIVNGQVFTGTTIKNGDTVAIRVAAGAIGTTVIPRVTIGGYTAAFSVTSVQAPDTTPDPFSFQGVSDVQPGTVVTSNTVTISGLNTAAWIGLHGGGSLIVNGQEFTGSTVKNGDTVAIRVTAGPPGTLINIMLNLGGYITGFNVGSIAKDTMPDPFVFQSVTDAQPGTWVTSNTVTISGLNTDAPIALVGGLAFGAHLIINGQTISTGSTVKNGDTVAMRMSAPSAGSTIAPGVSVGGYTTYFSVTSVQAPDTTPDPFTFQSVYDVQPGTVVTSNTVTISGLATEARITLTGGGTLIVNGQPYTGTTIKNGDTVAIQVYAGSAAMTLSPTVTVGTYSATFSVTTKAVPQLKLYQISDFFGTTEMALPYVANMSLTASVSGASTVTVGKYSLIAAGRDFTLKNLQIVDGTGATVGTFDGLTEGMVIRSGQSVNFNVIANRTYGARKTIVFSFDVDDSGRQFTINLELTTN